MIDEPENYLGTMAAMPLTSLKKGAVALAFVLVSAYGCGVANGVVDKPSLPRPVKLLAAQLACKLF